MAAVRVQKQWLMPPTATEITWKKHVAVGSWRGVGLGVLTGGKLFPVLHQSRALIMPFSKCWWRDFLFFSSGWKSPPTLHVETKQTEIIVTWDYPSASLTNSSQHIHSVTIGTWTRVSLMGGLPWLSLEAFFPHLVPIFLALNFGSHLWEASATFLIATLF